MGYWSFGSIQWRKEVTTSRTYYYFIFLRGQWNGGWKTTWLLLDRLKKKQLTPTGTQNLQMSCNTDKWWGNFSVPVSWPVTWMEEVDVGQFPNKRTDKVKPCYCYSFLRVVICWGSCISNVNRHAITDTILPLKSPLGPRHSDENLTLNTVCCIFICKLNLYNVKVGKGLWPNTTDISSFHGLEINKPTVYGGVGTAYL